MRISSPTRSDDARALPPPSSRLSLRGGKNRRRPGSLWSRLPQPTVLANACGRALRRALPALLAIAALGIAGTAVWLGHRFLTTSPRFAITAIEVHGAEHLTADEVRGALPVAIGDNVFTANTQAVARALLQHPWIAAASAQRILPDRLVVEIREHRPIAVASFGEPYLIGENGHPFKRAQGTDGAGLPILTGFDRAAYQRDPAATAESIEAALAALARWRANPARPAIAEVRVGAHGTLALHSDAGAEIELGTLGAPGTYEAELAARMETFDAAWAELSAPERARARTFYLDARPHHLTVAFAKD